MRRKEELVVGETYHVFNKSIAGFKIFNSDQEYLRMRNAIRYFHIENMPYKFCQFMEREQIETQGFNKHFISVSKGKDKLVQIVTYCLMPTHLHLILKQLKENGISIFMGNLLNSYSRYFNTKLKRKGPLWESKFKNVLVDSDEQLLHLTRYIHLNSVTSYLVDKPQHWQYSSYHEYLQKDAKADRICEYNDILEIEPTFYKEFVEDGISYQRELGKIKNLLLE